MANRPAVRVDAVVLFADGTSRELTDDELARLDAGQRVTVDPRSGRRTPLVGEDGGGLCERVRHPVALVRVPLLGGCERGRNGVDEVDLRDAGHPAHYRCRACLDTFP